MELLIGDILRSATEGYDFHQHSVAVRYINSFVVVVVHFVIFPETL